MTCEPLRLPVADDPCHQTASYNPLCVLVSRSHAETDTHALRLSYGCVRMMRVMYSAVATVAHRRLSVVVWRGVRVRLWTSDRGRSSARTAGPRRAGLRRHVASTTLWEGAFESTPAQQTFRSARRAAVRHCTVDTGDPVVAGVSASVGLDVAIGRQVWYRRFERTLANPVQNDTSALCSNTVPTMAQTSRPITVTPVLGRPFRSEPGNALRRRLSVHPRGGKLPR